MTKHTPSPQTAGARVWSFLSSPRGWLALLLLFHLCANIWWLWADNHAIRTDEETHMIMARDYYNALFPRVGDRGLTARLLAMGRIRADVGNPVHPPLLHIAGAVLVRIIGYSVDRLAFINTLAFLAALVGVFLITRKFLDEGEAFFAVLVFSFTPMVYAASRYFMTDFLSMALVVWVMYALLRSNWFSDLRWSLAFGALNGLALLARTTAVLYYLLPAMVIFGAALVMLFERREQGWHFDQTRFGRLMLHAVMIVLVTLVVASPWYIAHGGQFYQHWMKPQKGGAGAPIAILSYNRPPDQPPVITRAAQPGEREPNDAAVTDITAQAESDEDAAPAAAVVAPAPAATGRWRLLLRRRINWIRYPVFVINNGVFLPMFVMSLLGIAVCGAARRFRRRFTPWLLVCWLLGSYYLLTIVLSFATPRYALQALPALAVLSALPVLALPRGRVRLAAQLLYAGVLLFQYGNLTVHAYGPLAEAKLPIILDQKYQQVYDDPGLYFYKPILHASSAYGRMQAPSKDNFKDRLFFAMLKAEQERPFSGIEANYARLNIRGMIFDQQHFWLDVNAPNPFRRKDIPPELAPYRNFKHYGWGRDIDAILPVLSVVDYVAYTTEGIDARKEQEWLRILEGHGFELIDRFHEERFGQVRARDFGVLARVPKRGLPEVTSMEAIQKLNLEQLYSVRYSRQYARMSPELQTALSKRMNALFSNTGKASPMNDSLEFRGAAVVHEGDLDFGIVCIFRVLKPVKIPYRMMFRGVVQPVYMATHFNAAAGKAGVFRWNFDPSPSPPLWPANEFIMLRFPITVEPVPYQLSFAFYTNSGGVWGDAIDMGTINFPEAVRAREGQ